MNADYQLRHATVSRHGSFWGTQTDADTLDKLRKLSRTASVPSRLQHVDAGAAYAIGARTILKEDLVIDFRDGHFAVTGADMQSYVAVETEVNGVYTLTRSNDALGNTGSTPRPHAMLKLTLSELTALTTDVPALLAPGVWFLIPKPADINPIVLATKKPGVDLTYGVDFFTSKNFIITQLPPAEYFEAGAIIASVAEVSLETFDAFVSDSPRNKKSRKWVNTFAKRAQSMELFRRAAAEFCGLYVLAMDDIVLSVQQLPDASYVYAFAGAGVAVVDYPHTPLAVGTSYPAGYVVCDLFELRNTETHGSTFLTSTGEPVSLEGLFGGPLQLPADGVVNYSFEFLSPTLKTHLQLYFPTSDPAFLDMVWTAQRLHELRTGLYLSDELGVSDPETFPSGVDFPPTLDAAALLTTFYGKRLHLLAVDGLPPGARFELRRFLRDNAPLGSIVLISDAPTDPFTLPAEVATPPEGNIFYNGAYLYFGTYTLSYED